MSQVQSKDPEQFGRAAATAKFCLPACEACEQYFERAFALTVDVMEDAASWGKIERLAEKLAISICQQGARLETEVALGC